MSIISDAFNRLLELDEGQKIQIAVDDMKQLHSYRTMFYKEREMYRKKTEIYLPMTCHKRVLNGNIILEVSLSPVEFKVIGGENAGGKT